MMTSSTVWLASYPKSGNTWVRALLSALEHGEDPSLKRLDASGGMDQMDPALGVPIGDLSDQEIAAMLRTSWAIGSTRGAGHVRRKTHNAWVAAADGYPIPSQPAGARAVYIVRDPRAVVASWAHHLGCTLEQAVEEMATDERPLPEPTAISSDVLSSWSGHVRSWLDECDLPLLLVTYEDLLADTSRELVRIADFVGLPHTQEAIASAVAACSFTTLAAREIVEGFAEAAAIDRPFFRRGEAQAWREELPEALAERICRDHGEIMSRLGYLPDAVRSE